MVKLIRLNTSNSDAHFKASFDTDIVINENSKIALKNLTFESDFTTFNGNNALGQCNFVGNALVLNSFFEQHIEEKTYSRSNVTELENEVNQAYNRTISLQDGKTNDRGHVEIYGQFRLSLNNTNRYSLEYRQSNAFNVARLYTVDEDSFFRHPSPNKHFFNEPQSVENCFNRTDNETIKLADGISAENDARYMLTPSASGLGISKGAGVFYCRIKTSVVQGDITKNGFSIGLSFGNPRRKDTEDITNSIDQSVRNCEIMFNDANTNYKIRNSAKGVASVETDSGRSPTLVNGGTVENHDILMFKLDNNINGVKIISAHLYHSDGSQVGTVERLLFTHILSDEELNGVITPYIYFYGDKDHISIDCVRFTPDPFFETNGINYVNRNVLGRSEDVCAKSKTDGTKIFEDVSIQPNPPNEHLREIIAIYYPSNRANFLNFPAPRITPSLSMGGSLGEALGFNKLGDISEITTNNGALFRYTRHLNENGLKCNSFGIRFDAQFDSLINRQNSFIVDSMTLPLLSYNSGIDRNNTTPRIAIQTMGSRKNILATIPLNNDESIVNYEPNEIVYIDIKNDNKLNIRNLELRVLDNNFQPIRIVGEADMCLLIDN